MKIVFYYNKNLNNKWYSQTAPLGLLYISSYLKRYGNFTDITIVDNLEKIFELKPNIVGFTCYTPAFPEVIKLGNEIKKKLQIPLILGGQHISSIPETLPKCFDVGVIGEGESTMLDLVKIYSKYGKINLTPYLSKIPGIVFNSQGIRKINKPRAPIENIDEIPPPDLNINIHTIKPDDSIIIPHIHTSRGCPFKCRFCSTPNSIERVRFHSPKRVINDIKAILEKYPKQNTIVITDDMFTADIIRLKEIVNLIKKEELNNIIYYNFLRVNSISPEVCLLLREMNCRMLVLSLDSVSDRVIKFLKGEGYSAKDNKRVLNMCLDYGLVPGVQFILGSPVETKEDLYKTAWFLKRYQYYLGETLINHLTPLPNTDIWNYSIKKNLIDKNNVNWKALNLDFVPKQSIFMNQNYSLEYYTDVLKKLKYIQGSINYNNTMILKLAERKANIVYQNFIYKHILKFIPINCYKILEVNPYSEELIQKIELKKRKKYNIVSIKPNVFLNQEDFKLKYFDLIIYCHSLEQTMHPYKLLSNHKEYLKDNGYLMALFYNVRYILNVKDLLGSLSWLYTHFGIRQVDNIIYFSDVTMSKFLKDSGFDPIKIEPVGNFQFNQELTEFDVIFLSLLKKYLGLDPKEVIYVSQYISYIITARKIPKYLDKKLK